MAANNESQTSELDDITKDPPRTLIGTLLRLGPGMIIAGSIVGSGELIATTKAGAEAGFWLLWLIIIGCVIKVSTQIEFGRHAVTWGRTPLKALNSLPGPRLKVNWLLWYWTVMTMLVISQQGGIVGGVGQALASSTTASTTNWSGRKSTRPSSGRATPTVRRLTQSRRRLTLWRHRPSR